MSGLADWRVDDELNLVVFDRVKDVGAAFMYLQDKLHIEAMFFEGAARTLGGDDFEAEVNQVFDDRNSSELFAIVFDVPERVKR